MAACALYTTTVQGGYSGSGNKWGTVTIDKWGQGYQFAWAAAGCNALCLCFLTMFLRYMTQFDED